MLTDVFATVRPHLTIMDGIVAMEGEGPANGNLRQTNVILASRDAVALDTVATSIIKLNPEDIGTILYCNERGLGVGNLEAIEVTGETIRSVAVPDFQPPAASTRSLITKMSKPLPSRILRFVTRQTVVRLKVVTSRCTGCAECVRICPTGAAKIAGKTATIDKTKCIQCMCCQEVCRDNAITLRRSPVGSIMSLFFNVVRRIVRR
jgi:ferredoxin